MWVSYNVYWFTGPLFTDFYDIPGYINNRFTKNILGTLKIVCLLEWNWRKTGWNGGKNWGRDTFTHIFPLEVFFNRYQHVTLSGQINQSCYLDRQRWRSALSLSPCFIYDKWNMFLFYCFFKSSTIVWMQLFKDEFLWVSGNNNHLPNWRLWICFQPPQCVLRKGTERVYWSAYCKWMRVLWVLLS